MSILDWVAGLVGRRGRHEEGPHRHRGQATHVVILDGTMSSLNDGCETNAGITFKLLCEEGLRANITIYYEAGIQWHDWAGTFDVMTGKGINRQIRRAYGVLASRYRPGDKIVLVGYSRGAYAVRSLAGIIDMVGLLKANHATVSGIRTAYRHYEAGATSPAAADFHREFCYDETKIEAVAVWDTVKALGMRLPLLWRFAATRHAFHNHALGQATLNGFHALAFHERRMAYEPILWETAVDWGGHMEQVWFRGTHGDIGGQVGDFDIARPLGNIPLVWMLDRLEMCGVQLPNGWRARFSLNAEAPSIGLWRGWAKLFWMRRARIVGRDPSERLHETLATATTETSHAVAVTPPVA